MSNLPEDLILAFDEDLIISKDPKDLLKVFKDLCISLKRMYSDIAEANNQAPEYEEGGADATPDINRMQIWKDTDGSGKIYLAYNDNGNIVKVELT